MKDEQKVYIKGSAERGDEVIKTLIDLGGRNTRGYHGHNNFGYYYISPEGVIDYASTDSRCVAYSFLREFYKEIQLPRWKPGYRDRYFYLNTIGGIIENVWYGIDTNENHYKFGNCFRTPQDAEIARDNIKQMLTKE